MKRRRGIALMTIGALLLTASAALTTYNTVDDRRASKSATEILQAVETMIPQTPSKEEIVIGQGSAEIVTPEMSEREINGHWYIGKLEFPSLGITLPVMSQWSYPNLKIAPCRYSVSVYQGDFVLAAHNYSSHFGRLKELPVGAAVVFTDMNGQRFTYTVMQAETLSKTAVEDMQAGDWDLTLFTCTFSGESRFTLRCELVDANN